MGYRTQLNALDCLWIRGMCIATYTIARSSIQSTSMVRNKSETGLKNDSIFKERTIPERLTTGFFCHSVPWPKSPPGSLLLLSLLHFLELYLERKRPLSVTGPGLQWKAHRGAKYWGRYFAWKHKFILPSNIYALLCPFSNSSCWSSVIWICFQYTGLEAAAPTWNSFEKHVYRERQRKWPVTL